MVHNMLHIHLDKPCWWSGFRGFCGNLEEFDLRLFLFVTFTPAGGLPLAVILTSNESTDTITQAMEKLKSLLPGMYLTKKYIMKIYEKEIFSNCRKV